MSDIAPDAPEMVDVADLTFDLKNPRLVEFDMTGHSGERDVVRTLWETMDVRELVMSIAASGFFRHEPVVVCREDDRNVVIEGNRRLAAVKLMLDAALAQDVGATIPHLPATERARPVFDRLRRIWRSAQNGQRRGQSRRRPLRTNGTQARSRQETARHGQRLMFKWPETPSPRAEANELADFAELEAWRQGSFSRTEFSKALGRLDDHDYTHGVPDVGTEVLGDIVAWTEAAATARLES